nr:HDOD domain-containing protein [Desulfobotulus pelophilus]
MPEILIRAKNIVDSPYSDIRDLAQILEKDQAMTTRLLKLANSAYYGLRHPVDSAHKACLVLGEQTLLQMITLVSTSRLFSNSLDGYDLEAATVFSHVLFVALASREICRLRFKDLEKSAFAAGLLHDAGMLILDQHIRKNKQAYQKLRADGMPQHLAEKKLFGYDHGEIGHDFCLNWNVPPEQALAIHWHHEPDQSQTPLAHVLYVADMLAWQDPDRLPSEDIAGSSMDMINLSDEELEVIRCDVWQDVAQIAADILIS